ncbi:alanine racemase [Paenibacillus sp. 1P07SE]|uniref:alanine racemase n=1 Tax=Paenibacillus sp. 1P07SE TaxID=3132209 RepID=UPI0039A535DC
MVSGYEELSTPAVVIDLDIMEANIVAMAERLRTRGIQHRPHIKSHKSLQIARRQLAAGATGITVAKLSEAETFVRGGITNLLIAYPIIGEDKLQRLAALHRLADLTVTADSIAGAEGLSRVGVKTGKPLRVLVEIDGGLHRGGRQPGEDALAFARRIVGLPGLEVCGLMGYFGTVYRQSGMEGLRAAVREESAIMGESAERFRAAGLSVNVVSTGSSPAGLLCEELTGVTEVRAGNYAFFDASAVAMGLAREEDCALRVVATVVSTPLPGYATIDAGTKTLTSDRAHHREDYGIVIGRPDVRIAGLNEEHGFLRYDPEGTVLSVGDRLEIIPNHSCVLPNLCDRVAGRRQGVFAEWIVIDARGCSD